MTQLRQPEAAGLRVGWTTAGLPAAPLLLIGVAAGPGGIGLLSQNALAFVDPVVPVALGVLGVLVGLSTGAHRAGDGRMVTAAALESVVTGLLVAAGVVTMAPAVFTDPAIPVWMLALIAAICAATSLALPTGSPAAPGEHAKRVIELDALLVVAAGGVVLAFLREASLLATLSVTAQASAAALVLATAGWLLLTRASSDTEERVFTFGALLLVGGAADYLALSALLSGLLAGIFWQRAGGPAREFIRRDALYVQHPLVVLLLLVAGARAEVGLPELGLAVAYVFLRATGKIAAGWMSRLWIPGIAPRNVTGELLPPGVLGVAFALNAVRAYGPEMSGLLTVVVIGTAGAQLLAAFVNRRGAVE